MGATSYLGKPTSRIDGRLRLANLETAPRSARSALVKAHNRCPGQRIEMQLKSDDGC